MDFSKLMFLTIPEGKVEHIICNGATLWKRNPNWVPVSIGTNKSIYNGGKGYTEGYRLSSSGSLKVQSNTVVTGFIPSKNGDIVRMAGVTWGTTEPDGYSYIAFYDSQFNLVATLNKYRSQGSNNGFDNAAAKIDTNNSSIVTDSNGVTTFNIVVNSTYSYIRINATGTGENMIVTVNEEIAV